MPREGIRIPTLRILAYPEGAEWVAHSLELDIVAVAEDAIAAIFDLRDLIDFQIEEALMDSDLARIFHPAPARIWHLYSIAEDLVVPERRPVKKAAGKPAKKVSRPTPIRRPRTSRPVEARTTFTSAYGG